MIATRYCILTITALLALCWGGCSQQTVSSANTDVSRDISKANQEVDKLGAQAKPQLDKLDLGARVTAALQANANLPHTIRVDAGTGGVRLRGTVETAHQKALAGDVARQTLPAGMSVNNQLNVKA